ncbi:hypothetical protein F4778DRAFT_292552 [Xylariomycetidae sp. FL2044]|nr:hypothetical protein F4778DRAFT_292552 [Xylariomycetidae sp. FL2044]
MALTEREMTPQTAALDALVVELIDYKQWKLAQDESEGDRLAEMERRFRYTRCAFEAVRVARSRLYSKKLKQFRSGVTTQPEMTGAARPRNDISAASQQQKKIKESNGEITATAPPPEGSSPRPTTASPVGLHNSTPRQHRSAGRSTRRRRRLSSPQSENDDPQSQAYQEADEAGLSRRTVRTRSQTQKSLESRRVSARPAAKKARVEETVDFNDIYKRGAAKEKHAMIQFPKKSGNWYILRCSEHDASFGLNPLLGASRHLMGDGHAMAFRDDELSVQLLGVRVRDCDRAKADRNNSAMRRRRSRSLARTAGAPNNATASYSEGIISLDETTDSSSSEEEGIDLVRQESTAEEEGETEEEEESEEEEAEVEESAGEAENASNHAGTPSAISPDVPKPGVQGGVVDPRPGEIYRVFWKPSGIWCTALSVPVSGSFAKVGLTGSLLDTGAIDDSGRYPACYRSDGRVFRGWSVGYEDGGSMMWRRKFPFMWFGISDVDIDLDDELYNPKKAYFNWFPVHFIQPLNLADPRSESIKGYQWACQYSAWLEKRRLRHTAGMSS